MEAENEQQMKDLRVKITLKTSARKKNKQKKSWKTRERRQYEINSECKISDSYL